MVGFIILMGVVVNNAILLADQARAGERAGLPTRAAIHEALRLRVRPIFATTLMQSMPSKSAATRTRVKPSSCFTKRSSRHWIARKFISSYRIWTMCSI